MSSSFNQCQECLVKAHSIDPTNQQIQEYKPGCTCGCHFWETDEGKEAVNVVLTALCGPDWKKQQKSNKENL